MCNQCVLQSVCLSLRLLTESRQAEFINKARVLIQLEEYEEAVSTLGIKPQLSVQLKTVWPTELKAYVFSWVTLVMMTDRY